MYDRYIRVNPNDNKQNNALYLNGFFDNNTSSLVRRMMYATVLAILYYTAILVFIIIWMDFLTTILVVLV